MIKPMKVAAKRAVCSTEQAALIIGMIRTDYLTG